MVSVFLVMVFLIMFDKIDDLGEWFVVNNFLVCIFFDNLMLIFVGR